MPAGAADVRAETLATLIRARAEYTHVELSLILYKRAFTAISPMRSKGGHPYTDLPGTSLPHVGVSGHS